MGLSANTLHRMFNDEESTLYSEMYLRNDIKNTNKLDVPE